MGSRLRVLASPPSAPRAAPRRPGGPLSPSDVARELDGKTLDLTRVDPSLAGSAGACALVTTVQDLARFLNALGKGRLFLHRATLRQMLDLAPAQAEGGLAAYGLGIERYALPGGVDLVGHLGGTAGYRSFVGSVRPLRVTVAFALNAEDDPTPLVIPVVQALASINVRRAEG